MILQRLSPEHAKQAWPLLEPYVLKLVEAYPDEFVLEQTIQNIADQNLVSWVIWDERAKKCYGVVLTEAGIKPSGRKIMQLHVSGDDIYSWAHLIEDVERHAIENGCAKMEIIGRTALKKVLPEDYRQDRITVFTKELGNGAT